MSSLTNAPFTTVQEKHVLNEVIIQYHDTEILHAVRLQDPPVVTDSGDGHEWWYITFDTGGWFTRSTRSRMNRAARHYNFGYHLWTDDEGKWWVDVRGDKSYPWPDNWNLMMIVVKRFISVKEDKQ